MARSGNNRMKSVWAGIVVGAVLAGGTVEAEIIRTEPAPVGLVSPAGGVQGCDFSADGLELYVGSDEGIRVATRPTVDSDWGPLGPVIAPGWNPSISPDGLELYLDTTGDPTLRMMSRASQDDPWDGLELVVPPVGSDDDHTADLSADGLSLYFVSSRPGGCGGDDIWVARRVTSRDAWGAPANLGPAVNGPDAELSARVSSDGLTLFFSRGAPANVWASTRRSTDAPWGPAAPVALGMDGDCYGPALGPDGSTLYFVAADGMGGNDLWEVEFIPMVDLNYDGIVGASDAVILIDHWHTNAALCDVAPLPLGDGFVDIKDLTVFARYLPGEPQALARWPFDETDGDIAHSSEGNFDGTLVGEPVWLPEGGALGGALVLDGVDDHVWTHFYLSPGHGPLSVYARIKGGAPGQVVISQEDDADWLFADLVDGALATESPARVPRNLSSETVITDGQWHDIGLVWDGATRFLYVDGEEVARDTPGGLAKTTGRLILGAGKNLASGTFWSGLIDDVRIYSRAVRPQ